MGIAEACGIENSQAMTIAIDKWDKIGPDGVKDDMIRRGISESAADRVIEIFAENDLSTLESKLAESANGTTGIADLRKVEQLLKSADLTNELIIDPRLARGLDYYTGCIFEVEGVGYDGGSIGGGGRYDDLTRDFRYA